MRGRGNLARGAVVLAIAATAAAASTTSAVDVRPDRVTLELSVIAADPLSVDVIVEGQPIRVSSTSVRSVTVAAGEPVSLTLVDPGPDHVLTSMSCLEASTGILPDPIDADLEAGRITLGDPDASTACGFAFADAALAAHVELAVESDPADPAAAADFFIDTGPLVEPITVTPAYRGK